METDLLAIVGSLTLFPIEPFPHLPVAWTLTYEMMFYVLFAAFLLHARAGLALLVVWQMATLGHHLPACPRRCPMSFSTRATSNLVWAC